MDISGKDLCKSFLCLGVAYPSAIKNWKSGRYTLAVIEFIPLIGIIVSLAQIIFNACCPSKPRKIDPLKTPPPPRQSSITVDEYGTASAFF